MKTEYASDPRVISDARSGGRDRRVGRARADRIVGLAQARIARQVGSSDITDMTEAQLKDMCRRLMRG